MNFHGIQYNNIQCIHIEHDKKFNIKIHLTVGSGAKLCATSVTGDVTERTGFEPGPLQNNNYQLSKILIISTIKY